MEMLLPLLSWGKGSRSEMCWRGNKAFVRHIQRENAYLKDVQDNNKGEQLTAAALQLKS